MDFFTFLVLAGMAVYLAKQSGRLQRLEKGLSGLREKLETFSPAALKAEDKKEEPQKAPAETIAPAPLAPEFVTPPEPPAIPAAEPAPAPFMAEGINQPLPDTKDLKPVIDWERFTGIKLFSWIGGFALFLGAGFFVKYSIEHSLISPMVRVTLSFILGGACIGTGLFLKESRFAVTARALCAAGVPILYAAIFAACEVYHFMDPGTAFVLMSLVTAASFLLSVRMDSEYVALLAVIGGFFTPIFFADLSDRPAALFGYILLLDAGVAATMLRTGWTFLLPLCLIGTGFMQTAWFGKYFSPSRVLTAPL